MRVLVQAGHESPRQPGFESGTGAAGEVEYTTRMADEVVQRLRNDGRFDVSRCPGMVPDGWTGDVFLSFHCDGSGNPSTRGYSRGFPPAELGPKTGAFLAYQREEYEKLPGHPPRGRDNYTTDLSGYYGFHHVTATVKVLFEHGFVSNPLEADWLWQNVEAVADFHYRVICRYFGVAPKGDKPAPPALVEYGVWVAGPMGLGKVIAYAPRGHNRVIEKTREASVAAKLTGAALAKQLPRLKYVKRRTPPVIGKRL